MERRKSFLFYTDWRDPLSALSDEEQGRLIMALLDYEETGEIPDNLSGAANMCFSFMRAQLDRDREKYEARCEANRQNGMKGGRPPKEKGEES